MDRNTERGSETGFDQAMETLSRVHRRVILFELLDGSEPFSVSDIGESDRTRIALRHNHLPRLAEAEYIEWDSGSDVIRKGPRFEEIEPLLDLLSHYCDDASID